MIDSWTSEQREGVAWTCGGGRSAWVDAELVGMLAEPRHGT
jgi:hypothetical protein